jgi:hypothetical protein
VILVIASAIIILAFLVLAAIAAGAVLFLVVVPHAATMYHAPTATATPTPVATVVLNDWQQLTERQAMPEHHISGKAFSSNTHAILITSSNGESYWGYCGAAGEYDMTIRTNAKEYTFSVYEMPEMSRVYGSNWKQFSQSGNDVVNVDCANM